MRFSFCQVPHHDRAFLEPYPFQSGVSELPDVSNVSCVSDVSTVPEMSEVPDVSSESGLTSVSCVWDLLGVSGICLVLECFWCALYVMCV